VLPSRRALAPERVALTVQVYERLIDLYSDESTQAAGEDLSLTLIMAITHPDLYSDDFLHRIVLYAGYSDEDLNRHHVVRILGRGFVDIDTFDGILPVRRGPLISPPNPLAAAARALSALHTQDRTAMEALDLDGTAEHYCPLFLNRHFAFPVLQALSYMPDPSPDFTTAELTTHNLRLVDLTLTFHSLVRSVSPPGVFGPVTIDTVIRLAGEEEAVLNREGLTRDLRRGLILWSSEG